MHWKIGSLLSLTAGVLCLACSLGGGDQDVIAPGKRKLMSRVTYVDASGTRHSLAEHLGKVVVVDVWATWCPPCRKALPEIAALQGAAGTDYAVLAISVDRKGWEEVRPFLNANAQMGLNAVLPADRESLKPFGEIPGIPTTLIVDRKGRLRERWSGYYEGRAQKALREALAES